MFVSFVCLDLINDLFRVSTRCRPGARVEESLGQVCADTWSHLPDMWSYQTGACPPHSAGCSHRVGGWNFTVLLLVVLQLQQAMQGNKQAQNYDTRAYDVCAPWTGQRGDAYVRVFKPSFLNGLDNIADDLGVSKPSEHFMRWQLYLRWLVFCGLAVVVWVSTDEETGDIMTKVLPLPT